MTAPIKVQLTGGVFQDSEGGVLAFGYLNMELNQDENISGVGQIASGVTIKILLDGAGSVLGTSALTLTSVATSVSGAAVYTGTISGGDNNKFAGLTFVVAGFATGANNGTFICTVSTATTLTLSNASASAETHAGTATAKQAVWGNDQELPANAYYRVTGYTASGQPAWGPNNQQVNGNGGTFDVGTWVPNVVLSWSPPLQPADLLTNSVENPDQQRLNFENTATITWSVDGSGNLQATGAAGVDLQVNSVDNADQTKLNFEDTASVTWASTAGGVVKATAVGVDLQTNGVDNTDQAKLNLKAGTNVTLTADGVGGVTIDGADQGANVQTAGQGYLISSNLGISALLGGSAATATALTDSINRVYAVQFVLPYKIKITKATLFNAASGSANISFGIYSADGQTQLLTTGVFALASDGNAYTNTIGAVTLSPGIYWLAWTSDSASKNIEGVNFITAGGFFANFFNALHPHYALCGNAGTGGGVPSALGTLTAQNTVFSSAGIPFVLFEP